MKNIEQIMTTCPVIPVIVIEDIESAVPLATALVKGGLTVLEVTLRTDCALAAIAKIKREVPDAIVGAGTVITPEDMDRAIAAGSEFIVSPGVSPELLSRAMDESVAFLPGVATPSEAMTLLEKGISRMKFFPAQAAGGIPMLKSIAGPLPQIKFCPTGGINAANAMEFLALDNVLCVGGTWMLDKAAIAAANWSAIEVQARAAAKLH